MKNNNRKKSAITCIIIQTILTTLIVCITFVPLYDWLKILLLATITISNLMLAIHVYKLCRLYQKELEEELKKLEEKKKQKNTLLDIYAILGISPQYKSDGTLKNIFELLKIEPQYNEDGSRILTVYELLGINPKFSQLGYEIPYVFRIKNRINSLIKATATLPLYYVPRRDLYSGKKILPIYTEGNKEQEKAAKQKQPPIIVKVNQTSANKDSKKAEKIKFGPPTKTKDKPAVPRKESYRLPKYNWGGKSGSSSVFPDAKSNKNDTQPHNTNNQIFDDPKIALNPEVKQTANGQQTNKPNVEVVDPSKIQIAKSPKFVFKTAPSQTTNVYGSGSSNTGNNYKNTETKNQQQPDWS